jgi:hypothetical protein
MLARRIMPLIVMLGACADAPAEPVLQHGSGGLVGGRQAEDAEYPATVLLDWSCTGAKVGPRLFLEAAHCVHDTENNTVPPRGQLQVATKNAMLYANDAVGLEVVSVQVMQGWLDACQTPCGANVLSPQHPADIALIEVASDTPDIAEAYVDISPVLPGDALIETGYGCETGYGEPFDYNLRRLKLEHVVALSADRLLHPGSFVGVGDEGNIAASYVITPGAGQDHGASLCPGDSGGPLYRDDATQRLVVGVNAYYTFPQGSGVSTTNWHTRLDDESRYGVAAWLTERGVNVVDGCLPLCDGKQCGDDGCGGSCGACAENEACGADGQCMCAPSCEGKTCGDDGCGGSCGVCEPDAGAPPPGEVDAGSEGPPTHDDGSESDDDGVATTTDPSSTDGDDSCADHPGTPECAVQVVGKGCQLAAPRKGGAGSLFALVFGLLPWVMRRRSTWRPAARAATLGS